MTLGKVPLRGLLMYVKKKTMPLIRTYMHSSMKSLLRGLLVYAFSQIAFEGVVA